MEYREVKIPYASHEWLDIVPIGDIHLGNASADIVKLKRQIEYIRARKDKYWIGMGDYIEAINYTDPRFDPNSVERRYLMPTDEEAESDALSSGTGLDKVVQLQIRDISRLLRPIKDKCLGLLRGNHEECYSEDTKVLSKEGWKTYLELQGMPIGTEILTWKKPEFETEGILEFQPIKRMAIYDYDGEMVSLIGAKHDLLVTPSHRMIVKNNGGSYYVSPAWNVRANRKGDTHYIPVSGIWNNSFAHYTMEEIRLIGWLISEGSCERQEGRNPRISISQSVTANPKKVKEIDNLLNTLNIISSACLQKNNVKVWRFSVETTEKILKLMSDDIKRIPSDLLNGSVLQLKLLLKTLIKGDGTIWNNNLQPKAYYTSDFNLVEQLEELILKIGWNPTVTIREGKKSIIRGEEFETRDGYVVGFWRQTKYNGIQRKQFVSYKGKVWCPEVDNTFVVVKRNNKICISGNTIRKHYHYDVLYELAKDLELDRSLLLYDTAIIRLSFQRGLINKHTRKFDILVSHGNMGGRTYGHKSNRLAELAKWFIADVYFLAHSHTKQAQTSTQIYFDRFGNQKKKKTIYAITGCFLKSYLTGQSGYAEKMCLPPSDIGVVKLMLQPETGDLHISL